MNIMKLYIPTSSLNADSILSCECVSPARECARRVFGYSHFEPLGELRNFDFCTLAFSKVPRFNIYDDTRINYRMVVEIDVPSIDDNNLSHIGRCEETDIFATANPIHLSPCNTRLLFYKKEEMEYVYHNCSDSAKCKFFDFFKYGFCIVASPEHGAILADCVDNINVPSFEPTYSENAYNKVKGFIWGYAIGCLLSKTSKTANLLKIQKRIYDIISSTRTDAFIPEALRVELGALDLEYSKYDPIQRLAISKWEEYLKTIVSSQPELGTKVTAANIDKLLRDLGVETVAKSKFLSEQKLVLRKPLSSYSQIGTVGYEQYNQELVKHTEAALWLENMERIKNISFKDDLDVDRVSYHAATLSSEDTESTLFNKILHRIVWSNLIHSLEEIRINRKDVAVNVVKTLKSIIEDSCIQWQESEIQTYFDCMRKNISKYEPFELTDISDSVLQSIAAFILKGEDYESLKSYLEVNAISDYRYALALWGAMIGYVSIPRALFDGFELSSVIKLYQQVESILGNPGFILTHTNPHQIVSEPQLQAISQIDIQDTISNESADRFQRRVKSFFESTIVKNQKKDKRKDLRDGLYRALDEFGDDTNPIKFVSLLNDFVEYGWKPTLKPWQAMRDYLAPDYAAKTSRDKFVREKLKIIKPSAQPTLPFESHVAECRENKSQSSSNRLSQLSQATKDFSSRENRGEYVPMTNGFSRTNVCNDNNTLIFVFDENIWNHLKSLIPVELRDNVYRDLKWFQNEYVKGTNSQYYAKASRENAATIDAFGRYLAKKKYASGISLSYIIDFLKKFYVR